jgi:hypothetical protein
MWAVREGVEGRRGRIRRSGRLRERKSGCCGYFSRDKNPVLGTKNPFLGTHKKHFHGKNTFAREKYVSRGKKYFSRDKK